MYLKMKLVIFLLCQVVYCVPVWGYRTYYIEDECLSTKKQQKVVYNIPASGPDSVGEMRTNRFGTYSRTSRNCLIKLVPPDGYGVVVTIKKIDFRNHEPCEDYIKILSDDSDMEEKICGYQDPDKENKTYFSKKQMKIEYHTEDGGFGFHDGIRLIFTVAKDVNDDEECSLANQFKCANHRCIWVGLMCDGHNNCGDSSDESTTGSSHCPDLTPMAIALIVLGVTSFTAVIIATCICCCRAKRPPVLKSQITDFPSRPDGGYIPLPGYIYGTTGDTMGHLMYSPYSSSYPIAPILKRNSQSGERTPSALDLPPPYQP